MLDHKAVGDLCGWYSNPAGGSDRGSFAWALPVIGVFVRDVCVLRDALSAAENTGRPSGPNEKQDAIPCQRQGCSLGENG